MVILREYRFVMPMTVEEYQLAQEWLIKEDVVSFLRVRQQVKSTSGEGRMPAAVRDKWIMFKEVVNSIPVLGGAFELPNDTTGMHTVLNYSSSKSTKVGRSITSFISGFWFHKALFYDEEIWEAFPFRRTVKKNLELKLNFDLVTESVCLPGNNNLENALNLPDDLLNIRQVVHVDIASKKDGWMLKNKENPAAFAFVSRKTGRGPLEPGQWMTRADPCMTAYIVVMAKCDIPLLRNRIEPKMIEKMCESLTRKHRRMYYSIDDWWGESLEEVLQTKQDLKEELKVVLAHNCPPARWTVMLFFFISSILYWSLAFQLRKKFEKN